MTLSKKTQLAQAKRLVRRLEDDAPNVELRVANEAPQAREMALRLFREALERQRELVRELQDEQSCNK